MNKKTKKLIIAIFYIIIWMIIIFIFSNMDTIKSNGTSKGIIIEEIPTEEEKQNIVNNLNLPLRKIMHFTEYLILSLLLLNALTQTNIKNKYFITIIICFIYAITDEYHQTFIDGRTGQFIDVLIDTAGSTLGLIIYNKIIPKNKKRDKK